MIATKLRILFSAIAVLFYLLLYPAPGVSQVHSGEFTVSAGVGNQFLFEKQSGLTTLDDEKFAYGGSVFYHLNQRWHLGILFDYWNNRIYFNGIGGAPEYGKRVNVYRFGIGYQYELASLLSDKIQFSAGNSLDYYSSKISQYYVISGEKLLDLASYNGLGASLIAEARFKFLVLWSELSLVNLSSGKSIKDASLWKLLGQVPDLNLSNFKTGIRLSFAI